MQTRAISSRRESKKDNSGRCAMPGLLQIGNAGCYKSRRKREYCRALSRITVAAASSDIDMIHLLQCTPG
jgi:hypothetical protein